MNAVDLIVEEVRKAGEAYLARFNFDFEAACADLRNRSETAGRHTVALPPRLVRPAATPVKKVG